MTQGKLLLQTFLDESGHARDPKMNVLTLAGAISTRAQWERLVLKWQAVLDEFQLTHAHMKDFAQSVRQFEGWKGDEPRRQAYLSRLVTAIIEHTAVILGASVPLGRLKVVRAQLNPPVDKLNDPYYLCLLRMIRESALEATILNADRVQIIAADQPEFSAHCGTLYRAALEATPMALRNKLSPILSIESPANVIQLQVADLIAYEYNRLATDGIHRPDAAVRWPMARLLEHHRSYIHVFSETELRTILGVGEGMWSGE